tara:strand:+ start:1728 stop:2303 length:576 start_codon:yes stop_codon:yes gene_type:complete
MAGGQSRHPWYTRLGRKMRLDYLRILRTKGAPSQVARGVGYGIFVELIFFPTLGLAFFLMYPLNKFGKGHMGASLAGFVFAKLFAFLTIPPSFILGSKILGLPNYKNYFLDGETMKPLGEIWGVVKELFSSGELLKALAGWTTGAAVFGVVIGLIGFFIARVGLRKYQMRRQARREELLAQKEANAKAVSG